MKIQPDISNVQSVNAYGPDWVSIGKQKITRSVVLGSRGERLDWACKRFEDLQASHFAQLAELNAELVIFGSGQRLRFPKPGWLQPLIEKQIGLETMDTPAACRTFNVLASEGRHVIAALLIESLQG
jgi:uncharacterized protein